jgi:hypothetical protein
MMVYQEKIAPPNSLPVLASEPSDVLRSQRTIESLEQRMAERASSAHYAISDS